MFLLPIHHRSYRSLTNEQYSRKGIPIDKRLTFFDNHKSALVVVIIVVVWFRMFLLVLVVVVIVFCIELIYILYMCDCMQ